MSDLEIRDDGRDRALDAALGEALPPPHVPHAFRRRLHAALSRTGEADLSQLRARLQSERRVQLARLEIRYIRLRRGTLAAVVGTAFAASTAAVLALPWLQTHFGTDAPALSSSAGAVCGLTIALLAWHAHSARAPGW